MSCSSSRGKLDQRQRAFGRAVILAIVLCFCPISSIIEAQTLDQSPSISIDSPSNESQVLTREPAPRETLTGPPEFSGEEGTASDPVIATVGQERIRLSDLRFPPGKVPSHSEVAAALRQEIQDRVAYLEALKAGLDFNPNVILELARTRRSIISSALLEKMVGRLSKPPSEDDISSFIASRPDFFSGRRVYRFTEVRAGVPQPEDVSRIVTQVNSLSSALSAQYRNADDFVGWLKAQGFSFLGRVTVSRGSEELDVQSYGILKAIDGVSHAVVPGENISQVRVLFLHSNVPEPVDPELYRDNVKLGLFAKARTDALESYLNELVSKADVKIDDEKLAVTVEDLTRIVAAPGSAEMASDSGGAMSTRVKVKVFWLLFVSLISSFLAIRMVVLARQLWSGDDFRTRMLAIALPLLVALLLTASGWSFFVFERQGDLQGLQDVAVLPSAVGGLVGGLLVVGLGYLLSMTDRPYFKCALLLGTLSICHGVLLGGAMMGW